MANKRKRDTTDNDSTEKASKKPKVKTKPVCILHSNSVPLKSKPFTTLSSLPGDPKARLLELHRLRDIRLKEDTDSAYRMKDVCDKIPDSIDGLDLETHGYHRACYTKFVSKIDRCKHGKKTSTKPVQKTPSPRKKLPKQTKFPKECIICGKLTKKRKGVTYNAQKGFAAWKHKESGWEKVEEMARVTGRSELYRKVKGVDLFAVEARVHPIPCLSNLQSEYRYKIQPTPTIDPEQKKRASAYNNAYTNVTQVIQDQIIEGKDIISLSYLRDLYVKQLEENGYPNPEYRSEKLMKRLQKDEQLSNLISFTKVPLQIQGCISIWLVYSTAITVEDAIAFAYKLRSAEKFDEVALQLKDIIEKSYKESESKAHPWPPTPDEIKERSSKEVPEFLGDFLRVVLTANKEITCKKTERLIWSIGSDLCRAVTQGRWKLSKHLLLCYAVRHLFRSKNLPNILSRLGHSEPYDFSVELESALAKAIEEHSTYLTPQIICGPGNKVFHTEWDNLNRVTTNVTGSNVVNATGGMMFQEVEEGYTPGTERVLPQFSRKDTKNHKPDVPETLAPKTLYNKVGPKFPENAVFDSPDDTVYKESLLEYYVWLFSR